MSTRNSLAYGKNFHLFTDYLDEDKVVHLELDADCSCRHQSSITIPIYIWEIIRKYPAMRFDLADKTDAELLQMATEQVDERLKEFHEADNERSKAFISLFGCLTFGKADDPREEQISNGMKYYQNERGQQKEMLEKIRNGEEKHQLKEIEENDNL